MLKILIINDGKGTAELADYDYAVMVNDKSIEQGLIKGHNRKDGWENLVQMLLDQQAKKKALPDKTAETLILSFSIDECEMSKILKLVDKLIYLEVFFTRDMKTMQEEYYVKTKEIAHKLKEMLKQYHRPGYTPPVEKK